MFPNPELITAAKNLFEDNTKESIRNHALGLIKHLDELVYDNDAAMDWTLQLWHLVDNYSQSPNEETAQKAFKKLESIGSLQSVTELQGMPELLSEIEKAITDLVNSSTSTVNEDAGNMLHKGLSAREIEHRINQAEVALYKSIQDLQIKYNDWKDEKYGYGGKGAPSQSPMDAAIHTMVDWWINKRK